MTVREFYEQLGQDYTQVLERMAGNETFVLQFLRQFCEDETYALLADAVACGVPEQIFAAAHTLKGVTANLGLKPLYEKTCVLVEITRKGSPDGAGDAFAAITEAYEDIVAQISCMNES